MFRPLLLPLALLATSLAAARAVEYPDFTEAPHHYWERPLSDRFTQLKLQLDAGQLQLETGSELTTLRDLLRVLEIPVSSQMLVFSTTSLQLRLITPENPRALYFNEDVYVGYIPGGKLEIVAIDPTLGGIFYLMDMPRPGVRGQIERSNRCMNCHAREDTGGVPGLVIRSVVPGPSGGSLVSFRQGKTGHDIPFSDRFGGWYLTGKHGLTDHWANLTGRLSAGKVIKYPLDPGSVYDASRFPVPTSDILPHLLHEHQAGFVNRVAQAGYRARAILEKSQPTPEERAELDAQARAVTRYLLFADEVPLPAGGVEGDNAFKADFLRNRRPGPGGLALKDFDLQSRLFRHRCSYMIYSAIFTGLPPAFKAQVYRQLGEALQETPENREYAYLPSAEKKAIRDILAATLRDLPSGW